MGDYDDMNCRGVDPELFYPLETDKAGVQRAKEICSTCPALKVCLKDVMDAETGSHQYRHGIFAGLTPRQRYNLDRQKPMDGPVAAADVKACTVCQSMIERGKRSRHEFAKLRFCSRKCYGSTLVGQSQSKGAAA